MLRSRGQDETRASWGGREEGVGPIPWLLTHMIYQKKKRHTWVCPLLGSGIYNEKNMWEGRNALVPRPTKENERKLTKGSLIWWPGIWKRGSKRLFDLKPTFLSHVSWPSFFFFYYTECSLQWNYDLIYSCFSWM